MASCASLWVSAVEEEDEEDDEVLAPSTPPAPSAAVTADATSDAGREEELQPKMKSATPSLLGPSARPLWVSASDAFDAEDDEDELVPRTPVATKAAVVMPQMPLIAHGTAASTDGDEEGWVQVGRGGRPGCEPSPLLRKEASVGLEGDVSGVSVGTTRSALAVSPSDASVVVALVIGSASVVLAFLPLLETR